MVIGLFTLLLLGGVYLLAEGRWLLGGFCLVAALALGVRYVRKRV